MAILLATISILLLLLLYTHLIHPLFLHPLSILPGPKLYALTKWRLALDEYFGHRTTTIHTLHLKYGPAIRIGPNEAHFNSAAAVRTIYGAGSGFERTAFYSMFDVYGRPNLFTFRGGKAHSERKKLVAAAYSKSAILRDHDGGGLGAAAIVEGKVADFLDLVEREGGSGKKVEAFEALHFFSLDVITTFLYGERFGGTTSLRGSGGGGGGGEGGGGEVADGHRALLVDILDPDRRRLSWFVVHFPALVRWLYTREGAVGRLVQPLLPMRKPATYTGIRAHALKAMESYRLAREGGKGDDGPDGDGDGDSGAEDYSSASIISKLWRYRVADAHTPIDARGGRLTDLDIASECADHLLAGIDTTSDSLMFLFWALSLPENAHHQAALRDELRSQLTSADFSYSPPPPSSSSRPLGHQQQQQRRAVVKPAAADRLPYLAAVIKETLRLYSALPASEPRSSPVAVLIDGHTIPARTTVSCAPYSLHRNEEAFPEPLRWDPGRWISSDSSPPPVDTSKLQGGDGAVERGEGGDAAATAATMRDRNFWAFSSGARMCVGMHLAMAEMTAMVASVYLTYETRALAGPEGEGDQEQECKGKAEAAVKTPGFTSRFEVFCDEVRLWEVGMEEHVCWIEFRKLS